MEIDKIKQRCSLEELRVLDKLVQDHAKLDENDPDLVYRAEPGTNFLLFASHEYPRKFQFILVKNMANKTKASFQYQFTPGSSKDVKTVARHGGDPELLEDFAKWFSLIKEYSNITLTAISPLYRLLASGGAMIQLTDPEANRIPFAPDEQEAISTYIDVIEEILGQPSNIDDASRALIQASEVKSILATKPKNEVLRQISVLMQKIPPSIRKTIGDISDSVKKRLIKVASDEITQSILDLLPF